ncbi:hypothetical protein Tco_0451981 [Tanacetum coccineum]
MTFSNPLFDSDNDFSSSDDESFSDENVLKENFKIYLNSLFDEEIISSKIDPHHFNVESDLIESLLNRDISTVSNPKIDSLFEEFSGELDHVNLIPPGINEAYFYSKEDIRLVEKSLDKNSSPRPPEELNSEISDAIIESFSPIPVEDSDSLREEIDIFLALDDSIPPVLETLLPFSSENEDKVFNPGILVSKEEKSPHLLSHQGFKAFNETFIILLNGNAQMMINGGDISFLGCQFLLSIRLTKSSIGIESAQSPLGGD